MNHAADPALVSWGTLLVLGAFHGVNPGMGWLFAVALGMQENRASAVWRALVPLGLGHAGARITDLQAQILERNPDRRRAMLAGVLEEITDHPTQQARVPLDRGRLAIELDPVVARALFGGEREHIDRFHREGFLGVQPAGQQDLVDQGVELGDVLQELGAMLDAALDIVAPGSRVREDLQQFQQMGLFKRPLNLPVEIGHG